MRLRLAELVRQKEAREGRKIRQQEIAEALGISQQQVSVLMRGYNKQVSLQLLDRLADYFEVSVQELFETSRSVGEFNGLGVPLRAHDLVMLPVYGRIPAGAPRREGTGDSRILPLADQSRGRAPAVMC
ncbi:MAG: hypothetical protein KatS3mg115_2428 [Candidatus Poribacteria bacterium]|nr:MAG: hypothetical protein KatS3mg115_2428 [Candidatus Poribacteria bacterium]